VNGRGRGRPSQQHGQSVVEFALLLPIMLILMLAIADMARIYTTMMSVESAAREAADFGTTFGAGKWDSTNRPMTVSEMERRACVAASNLPDYRDPDGDPQTGGCTNPSFAYCVTPTVGGTCGPIQDSDGCDNPDRAVPCDVTVTLTYDFHLIAPVNVRVFDTEIGLPSTLSFERDSTYAITDIEVAP